MNRYDSLLKRQKVMIVLEDKDIDLSSCEVMGEGIYSLLTKEPLKVTDLVKLDDNGYAIKANDLRDSIGYVIDSLKAIQREQNRNTVNVKLLKNGGPNKGFLHDHPGLQQRLGVDDGHVIIDKTHWQRARSALMGMDMPPRVRAQYGVDFTPSDSSGNRETNSIRPMSTSFRYQSYIESNKNGSI